MKALRIFDDIRGERVDFAFRVRRRLWVYSSALVSLAMEAFTRTSRSLIVAGDAPTVSLTTYGARAARVHRTIASIGRGSVRPSRIVLWLDDERLFENLPDSIRRLKKRGLEVRLTENLGPHTKYFPFVMENLDRRPVVTADDDIIYPRWWLRRLVEAAADSPGSVVCYRAHRVVVSHSQILPYATWPSVDSREPDPTVMATGVSGVLYPDVMQEAIRGVGDRFRADSLSNDDIWLHVVAINHGIPVRQVGPVSKHFWLTPGSQKTSLMSVNLVGANDAIMSKIYGAHEIAILSAAKTSQPAIADPDE